MSRPGSNPRPTNITHDVVATRSMKGFIKALVAFKFHDAQKEILKDFSLPSLVINECEFMKRP